MNALRNMGTVAKVGTISAVAFGANVPLGSWRSDKELYSLEWFVAIHASVPAIILLRRAAHLPKKAIPINITAAVLGQYAGSKLAE